MINKRRKVEIVDHIYDRGAYKKGTRITRAQVAHIVGYLDNKTHVLFEDNNPEYNDWLKKVEEVKFKLGISPEEAARYVNEIYSTKLSSKYTYLHRFSDMLKNTCGKWFNVVPSMHLV